MTANKEESQHGQPGKLTSTQYGIYMQGQELTTICSDWLMLTASKGIKIRHQLIQAGPAVGKLPRKATAHHTDGTVGRKNIKPSLYLPIVQEIIADTTQLQVPHHILAAFRRLARFRGTCCSWFKDSKDATIQSANEGHRYFVEVLKRAHDLLLPFDAPSSEHFGREQSADNNDASMANRFECLGLVDCDAEDNQAQPFGTDTTNGSNLDQISSQATDPLEGGQNKPSKAEYRRICASKCFLQDAQCLMAHVEQKWIEHRAGKIDLVLVGVLTDVACDLMNQLEDDFNKLMKVSESSESKKQLFHELFVKTGQDGHTWKHDPTDAELFDFHTAFERCSNLVSLKRARIQHYYWNQHVQLTGDRRSSPQSTKKHIEFFRKHYIHPFVLSSNETVRDWTMPEISDELRDLDDIFSDCLGHCTEEHCCHSGFEDGIVRALRAAVEEDHVSLVAAWSLQLFVRIRDIMGDATSSIAAFDAATERLENALSYTTSHWQSHPGLCQMPTPENILSAVQFSSKMRRHEQSYLPVSAETDTDVAIQSNLRKLLVASPHTCAYRVFHLRMMSSFHSVFPIDARSTLRAFLHSYNIAKQLGDIEAPWIDMEYLIDIHTSEALFMGARPTNLETGLSAVRLAFPLRYEMGEMYPNRASINKSEWGGQFHPHETPVLCLVFGELREGSRLENLRISLIVGKKTDFLFSFKTKGIGFKERDKLERRVKNQQLDPLQFLSALEQVVAKEIPHLDFDYNVLEHRCYESLVELDNRLKDHPTHDNFVYHFRSGDAAESSMEYDCLLTRLVKLADTNDGYAKENADQVRRMGGELPLEVRAEASEARAVYDIIVDALRELIAEHGSDCVDSMKANEDSLEELKTFILKRKDGFLEAEGDRILEAEVDSDNDIRWVNVGNARMRICSACDYKPSVCASRLPVRLEMEDLRSRSSKGGLWQELSDAGVTSS